MRKKEKAVSNSDVIIGEAKTSEVNRVLIIERQLGFHDLWTRMMEIQELPVTISSALTLDQAKIGFGQCNGDLAVVVVAACMNPWQQIDTEELIRYMRTKFSGPMIATSSDFSYRQALISAGCSHECEKGAVPRKIKEVLGLE